MPEINPYEAPQSDDSDLRQSAQTDEQGYPLWIGKALNAQMALFFANIVISAFVAGPPNQWSLPTILAIAAILLLGCLTVALLISAIRYRIGWLVVLESIVLGLPLMAYLNSL